MRDIVTATATVPERSSARSVSITATPMPPTAPSVLPQQAVAKQNPSLQVIRYAAAVLKGQPDMLESFAACFVSNNARIKKFKESWVLESSEFAACTTGEQAFPIADDIVSRMNCILSLYCGLTATLSVDHINWIDAKGQRLRSIRGFASVDVFSDEGLAELKSISGTQPLGSVVFEAMILDPAVNKALTLHGDEELSWSQVYDIIEFVVRKSGAVKTGNTNKKTKTSIVRQAANHYRHLGNPKNFPLPSNPPMLVEASEFARSLLKLWISSRLKTIKYH